MATQPVFPELAGVMPGVGRYDPCPWGLGIEVRGDKAPHWTGTTNSSHDVWSFRWRRYLRLGGSGGCTTSALACVALTDRPFDEWADAGARAVAAVQRRRHRRGAAARPHREPAARRSRAHRDDRRRRLADGRSTGSSAASPAATGRWSSCSTASSAATSSTCCHVQLVSITNVELCLAGSDLMSEPELRRGLVALWHAEADTAGLDVDALHPIGDGLRDSNDSWALAELVAGGEQYVVRAFRLPNEPDDRAGPRRPAQPVGHVTVSTATTAGTHSSLQRQPSASPTASCSRCCPICRTRTASPTPASA